MAYISDAIAATLRDDSYLGIFFKLKGNTEPETLRFWLGYNDCPAEMRNGIDPAGTVYRGAGVLADVKEFDAVLQGQANRVEFSFSGVAQEAIDELEKANPDVFGLEVHIGIASLDADFQPRTLIIPLGMGISDFWSISYDKAKGTDQPNRVISLSVGFGETGRSRPRLMMWTPAQQHKLYELDKFCDNVGKYARGYQVKWPHF